MPSCFLPFSVGKELPVSIPPYKQKIPVRRAFYGWYLSSTEVLIRPASYPAIALRGKGHNQLIADNPELQDNSHNHGLLRSRGRIPAHTQKSLSLHGNQTAEFVGILVVEAAAQLVDDIVQLGVIPDGRIGHQSAEADRGRQGFALKCHLQSGNTVDLTGAKVSFGCRRRPG